MDQLIPHMMSLINNTPLAKPDVRRTGESSDSMMLACLLRHQYKRKFQFCRYQNAVKIRYYIPSPPPPKNSPGSPSECSQVVVEDIPKNVDDESPAEEPLFKLKNVQKIIKTPERKLKPKRRRRKNKKSLQKAYKSAN